MYNYCKNNYKMSEDFVIDREVNFVVELIKFCVAFSALTLLVGCQEGHPVRKNLTDEVLAWLSSGAKCK